MCVRFVGLAVQEGGPHQLHLPSLLWTELEKRPTFKPGSPTYGIESPGGACRNAGVQATPQPLKSQWRGLEM